MSVFYSELKSKVSTQSNQYYIREMLECLKMFRLTLKIRSRVNDVF